MLDLGRKEDKKQTNTHTYSQLRIFSAWLCSAPFVSAAEIAAASGTSLAEKANQRGSGEELLIQEVLHRYRLGNTWCDGVGCGFLSACRTKREVAVPAAFNSRVEPARVRYHGSARPPTSR